MSQAPVIHVHIHIDSPYITKERFSELSGMPLRTVQDRGLNGELPVESLDLKHASRKGASTYVNMVKLFQMAAASQFEHPRFPTVNLKS